MDLPQWWLEVVSYFQGPWRGITTVGSEALRYVILRWCWVWDSGGWWNPVCGWHGGFFGRRSFNSTQSSKILGKLELSWLTSRPVDIETVYQALGGCLTEDMSSWSCRSIGEWWTDGGAANIWREWGRCRSCSTPPFSFELPSGRSNGPWIPVGRKKKMMVRLLRKHQDRGIKHIFMQNKEKFPIRTNGQVSIFWTSRMGWPRKDPNIFRGEADQIEQGDGFATNSPWTGWVGWKLGKNCYVYQGYGWSAILGGHRLSLVVVVSNQSTRRRVVDLNPSELIQPCERGHFWNPPDNTKVKAYFTNQFFRKRGRPQMRWDDTLRKFGDRQFQQKKHDPFLPDILPYGVLLKTSASSFVVKRLHCKLMVLTCLIF